MEIQQYLSGKMCYLKDVMVEEKLDLNSFALKEEETLETVQAQPSDLFPCSQNLSTIFKSQENYMISKLFEQIRKNNSLISNLSKSLSSNSQYLEKITINFETASTEEEKVPHFSSGKPPVRENFNGSHDSICSRLFGVKDYQFQLKTIQKFEETLYRERNFNMGIKLVDKKGKTIRNNNLLTLCFAVCTSDGEWVHENRIGDPFMKGKTETELFKGEASFEKLHARQVSRIYPNGKVIIIVYPKPTSVKFLAKETEGECVESWDIEPLIIENISIKAKKKQ